jgi:hypothetical protein
LLRVDLESDGMPVKVMAAFGALPAMIDAWVLTRGRSTLLSGFRVVAGAVEQRLAGEVRCVLL